VRFLRDHKQDIHSAKSSTSIALAGGPWNAAALSLRQAVSQFGFRLENKLDVMLNGMKYLEDWR
jgi:hypothetical protein